MAEGMCGRHSTWRSNHSGLHVCCPLGEGRIACGCVRSCPGDAGPLPFMHALRVALEDDPRWPGTGASRAVPGQCLGRRGDHSPQAHAPWHVEFPESGIPQQGELSVDGLVMVVCP